MSQQSTPPPQFVLCPYCGHVQTRTDRCDDCNGLFEPLSRLATQIAMGPWYIRDKNMPYRPGCSFETLRRQIEAGKIKPTTVLRGPTTRQFWSLARNVPGVANLLGICHHCQAKFDPKSTHCPTCGERFEVPAERNKMGLMYTTDAEVAAAQKKLDRLIAVQMGTAEPEADDDKSDETEDLKSAAEKLPGVDLLDEVIGTGVVAMVHGEASRMPAAGASRSRQQADGSRELEDAGTAVPMEPGRVLDFSPAATPVSQPRAAAGAVPPAIASDSEPTAPVVRKKKPGMLNTFAALLLVMNVVAIGAAGAAWYLWWSNSQKSADDAGEWSQDSSAEERTPAPEPTTSVQSSMFESIQPPPSTTPRTTESTASQPRRSSPAAEPAETATPPARQPSNPGVQATMKEAQRLEEAGRYQEALDMLREVSRHTLTGQKPPELDRTIRRLEGIVAREQTRQLFEE